MPGSADGGTRFGGVRGSGTRLLLGAATALALLVVAAPAQALQRPINPADGGSGDHFGWSVALDGDTLVVGAPGKNSAQGAVYVYTRTAGETWTQSAKLTASDAANSDQLGYAVAIDGTTIVAGAPGDGSSRGSIYLFDRTGAASRTQREKLAASDGVQNDGLGQAVAIDGDTIVAGAPAVDLGVAYDANYGAVYTFATTGAAARPQTAKLTASDNTLTGFVFGGSALGQSVAIDGDTIVAGAPSDLFGNASGARRGSVYTFARTGLATRQETAKLTVSGQTAGRLGESVDILGDTIVAGDSEADDALGAAWTFARTGAARNQNGKLTPANRHQNMNFGSSVSMSSDFIAVGASAYPGGGGSPAASGGGYVFTRSGAANRTETWFVGGSGGSGDAFGTSIVTDGDRVVGGAPYVNNNPPFVEDQGRVFSSTPDLYVSKVGTGTGTVTASATGGTCESGPPCFGSYLLGDQVTLTATPSPGSTFLGWENYPGCSGTGTCVLTMTGEPQVAARFNVGDTTPPTASIGSGPANLSTVTTSTVTFGFTANETSTFQCAYDAESFAACTTPGPGTSGGDTRSNLTEATHTFKVRARDLAGNFSTELTRTFTVDLPNSPPPPPPADTTPPDTTVTKAPPKTVKTTKKKASVQISFLASEAATFLCSVDGKAAQACSSPAKFTLGVGKHTIEIVAVDSAGNRDASPAKVEVKVKKKKRKV